MTVRVRSLIRTTAAAARPPVPPVTMRFIQQPMDTVIGELFEPPITVQVSDRGSDVLLITIDSGDCHIDGQYATSDANGIATFEGLTAGSNPSVGCRLRVDNLTRPAIPSIISTPFNALPLPTVKGIIEVVNNGNAVNVGMSPDTSRVDITTQANGAGFNTTDANIIVVSVHSDVIPNYVLEFAPGGAPAYENVYEQVFRSSEFGYHAIYICRPVSTGLNRTFRVQTNGGYVGIGVIALRGWNGVTPTVFGANDLINAISIQLTTPLPTGVDNFILTSLGSWRFQVTAPYPYANVVAGTNSNTSYSVSLSWKQGTNATENPMWTGFTTGGGNIQLSMDAMMLEPAFI